ncbi:metallophosphoesterase family protein [Mitsuokella multacida]|uniref:metallophosphoesterase family protein n=1 Tax=Mitsuokella multacida TaxID=52226 RepID=UPI00242F8035|nr:metallophosphoesterase [Mitsuokella multacida]
MSRRTFLKLCTSALLALGLGRFVPAAAAGRTIKYPRQIITADSTTSRTIMWQAEGARQQASFTLTAPDGQSQTYTPEANTLVQDDTTTTFYTVQLTGLTPTTSYEGTIAMAAETVSLPIVTTARELSAFEALLIDDSQCGETYEPFAELLAKALARHPQAAFLADIGDLTDNGQSDWHWQSFFAALLAGRAKAMPFAPVMGNHECYGLDWKFALPRRYLASFAVPGNGSRNFPGYYYSFDYGPAHFIVLNTQFEELDGLKPGLLQEELLWLKHDAAGSHKPWKIVLMHKDVIAYDEYQPGTGHAGGISDVGHDFMKSFDALGIDLVLTGHMHTYRNRGHIYDETPSDHGPTYLMFGPAGNERYTVPPDTTFDKVSLDQSDPGHYRNYMTLAVTPTKCIATCHLEDGATVDRVVLTKDTPAR